ncbi:hypothetical protein J6590_078482 [Homalodisca vitripennis]|nr:hypothetical protein J6590_078482 [Homalodisca vitripennis]
MFLRRSLNTVDQPSLKIKNPYPQTRESNPQLLGLLLHPSSALDQAAILELIAYVC